MTNKSIRDYINLIENAQREYVAEGEEDKVVFQGHTIGHIETDSDGDPVGIVYSNNPQSKRPFEIFGHTDVNRLKQEMISQWNKRVPKGVAEDSPTMWEVSFDYGPHMSKTVKVKAGSKQEARAKVEKAAEKSYTRGIMINWVKPAKQGVAEEQLEETTPEALAKIDELTRK